MTPETALGGHVVSDHEHRDRWARRRRRLRARRPRRAPRCTMVERPPRRVRGLPPSACAGWRRRSTCCPRPCPQQEPPPALRARLMDVVEREARIEPTRRALRRGAAGASASASRGLALRPALAGLGVFLLVAAGVAGYALATAAPTRPHYAATGTGEGIARPRRRSRSTATRDRSQVANLPPTGRDEVYQAWVQDSPEHGGAVHPSSVFVVSEDGIGERRDPRRPRRRRAGHGHPRARGRQREAERELADHRRAGLSTFSGRSAP